MGQRKLRCHSSRNRTSFADISLPLLDQLPDDLADEWLKNLERWAKGFSTPMQAFKLQQVTTFWVNCHIKSPHQYPLPPLLKSEAHGLIKNLRRSWYEHDIIDQGVQMDTASTAWSVFLRCIKIMSRAGLFPELDFYSKSYRAFHMQKTRVSRGLVNPKVLNECASTLHATMDIDNDSYHSCLLVPLSIHLSDNEYLENYENELRSSINCFSTCANQEFETLQLLEKKGQQLIDSVDYDLIQRILNSRRRIDGRVDGTKGGYIDPSNGRNWFNPKGGHPAVFANNLALVKYEMGDLPQPYVFNVENRKSIINGKNHWRFPIQFGREKLFSHLGILTCRNAIPLIVLLLIDHPRLNVESLLNARLVDSKNQKILIANAGENGTDLRLTVNKMRAKSQKSSVLTPRGKAILAAVLKWTNPVRKSLIQQNRLDDARYLWVGFTHIVGYKVGRFSINQMREMFRKPNAKIANIENNIEASNPETVHSRTDFIRSHPSLSPWATTARLSSLRVSSGVLSWFESQGDVAVTARAFGHKNLKTTIDNYIPKPIQEAMYERQIRRWQNLMISAACAKKPYLLTATDFSTQAQLHEFICGLLLDANQSFADETSSALLSRLKEIINPSVLESKELVTECNSKTLLINDPQKLAVTMLYEEVLRECPEADLDAPDPSTKTTPRMWIDLLNVLRGPLPDSMHELKTAVRAAEIIAGEIRGIISFPTLTGS
ncbi:hypothetical protein [Mariprofundus ferrooxydans]|uniref:Uncharacterized protein n=1 Tax=Mariprofundus ferrooxydans PV-1 TaxID=314345 RepID=Q0F3E7_9PROT|nr:hypothetical protein [Mariprofundus ferrooxydans]EAU55994.1 hypothetical protein SPV1_04218 [Mariprofundus ferrooxydans PV-1]KON48263.1 hypothetical protein AL013_04310 [Mariprofundus ferrooxydans]